MIKADGHIFVLETAHTTYCFRRMETGHLEHLYYGRCLTLPEHPAECDVAPLVEKHTFAPGNTNLCDGEHPAFSLEDMRLEMSSYGKGDIREPFVEIVHADGSTTSDFRYESYEITEKTAETENGDLPGAYDERGEAQRLVSDCATTPMILCWNFIMTSTQSAMRLCEAPFSSMRARR